MHYRLSFRFLIIFVLAISITEISAQQYSNFLVRGNIYEVDSLQQEMPLEEVQIYVIDLLQDTSTYLADKEGNYRFILPYENFYRIEFDKTGFDKKSIYIDTRGIPQSSAAVGFQTEIDIILYEAEDEESTPKAPIALAEYNFLKNQIVFSKIDDHDKIDRKIERWQRKVEKKEEDVSE